MHVQQVLQTLDRFWAERGCILWQPYHTEVGAGTSNPATFLRVLGPEPWWVAYAEPSIRPADGRYGENPNRLQHYFQYQVILKPSPANVQELFLESLEALGLDLTKHDFRFVEDNWQSPSLGAWGLGWEAWLDGMEILQFTYFQECGGVKLDVRACELTYGIERICMYLQGVESVYDLTWAPSGITYGDIFHAQEVEFCKYNFQHSDAAKLLEVFDIWESEAKRLMDEGLVLPAYDHCLRLSHLFNLLDARGALSVTERGRFLLRCRAVAERCAKAFAEQREAMGYPLMRLPRPGVQDTAVPITVDLAAFNERDTLLLEIGVEELPHKDVRTIVSEGRTIAEKLLADCGIEHGPLKLFVGPRRIALYLEDVPAHQPDVKKELRGPKKEAARDADGNWTMPAKKFAEAHGIDPSAIVFKQEGKAEYCYVNVEQRGKRLADLLSEFVAKFVKAIPFVKSMGWEDSTVTFSRPVRWLLALHGPNAVPVSLKLRDASEIGPERFVHSGCISYGHRRIGPGIVEVPSAQRYLDALKTVYVLADRDLRMHRLRSAVNGIVLENQLEAENDADLFEEICDLVEWPEPILCTIPEEALTLPEPIVITPMKVHQRYIPLRTMKGDLSKHFLAVANGEHDPAGQDIIRKGNERVLNARLRDAKYFWDTDIKTPLAEFASRLSRVMFHQQLGTVADKIERLRTLYGALKLTLPNVDDDAMAQVLTLMKADLTTQMVGEFDSLEGLVGKLYAQQQGLQQDIADAIYEHRLPRRAGDALPEQPLGTVAGILDRLDSLAGYFGIGLRPKGTSDPYGLRRNALALLAILRRIGIDADLAALADAALVCYGDIVKDAPSARTDLLTFLADRLAVMARDEGHPYDHVAAALGAHSSRPLRFWRCLHSMKDLSDEKVQSLAEQTKRMEKIVKEPSDTIDASLLDDVEKPLYGQLGGSLRNIQQMIAKTDFPNAFGEVLGWVPVIEAYFEKVLVNDKDDKVRQNRHALVRDVLAGIRTVADFTAIEKR